MVWTLNPDVATKVWSMVNQVTLYILFPPHVLLYRPKPEIVFFLLSTWPQLWPACSAPQFWPSYNMAGRVLAPSPALAPSLSQLWPPACPSSAPQPVPALAPSLPSSGPSLSRLWPPACPSSGPSLSQLWPAMSKLWPAMSSYAPVMELFLLSLGWWLPGGRCDPHCR